MSNVIKIGTDDNTKNLKLAANVIKNGGIVIFPTETVYGIGTNGLDSEAVKKLYEVKNRSLTKPISLLVSNFDMINQVAKDIKEMEYKIMKNFFPGPLTIILNKKSCVPDILTANGNTVGIRMPDNEIALKLIELSEVPIATPSANISGKPSGTNIEDIKKDFEGKVDLFIDNGKSKIGNGSTIVKVENNEIKILRQGVITKEQIKAICK